MPAPDARAEIAHAVESAVTAALPEVEVVDVQVIGAQHLVRVVVDRAGGVDHALCQQVTRLLAGVRERYTLEVSSPGLDRPLTKPEHFARAVGETVQPAPERRRTRAARTSPAVSSPRARPARRARR